MDEVGAFLRPLGLERYQPMFAEEAITEVDLLRSMGEEMLREVRTARLLAPTSAVSARARAPRPRVRAASHSDALRSTDR